MPAATPKNTAARRAQLLQAGERQLHLRFDSVGPDDLQIRRGADQVLEQRRLCRPPRLAPQQQRAALSPAHSGDDSI
jgi:hypothetical protein